MRHMRMRIKMGVGWEKEKEVREYEKDVMRNVR